MIEISKAQVDRLGDRLRKEPFSEADLKLLDDYRKSYNEAYDEVVKTIREKINLEPTGRPAKSTSSIIDKLHREKIRLSQVQDIAGCRLVVSDLQEQDRVIALLKDSFSSVSVVDRRIKPSYGYRAVHVIIKIRGKLVEVQVRTELQHSWAEFSEKFSDKIDPAIKYGGGDQKIQKLLNQLSDIIKSSEVPEREISNLLKEWSDLKEKINCFGDADKKDFEEQVESFKRKLAELLLRRDVLKQRLKDFMNTNKNYIKQKGNES